MIRLKHFKKNIWNKKLQILKIRGFIENQPEIKIKTSTATIPIPCCKILPPPRILEHY